MVEEDKKVYEELLNEVNKIIQKKENKYNDLALDFNFFTIARINKKEVINCRFLYELLNPNGSHSEGTLFLKKFVQNIVYDGDDISKNIINDIETNSTVKKEETVDGGRVDIVIHIKDNVIPIEVKIGAKDQSEQIKRYYDNYKDCLIDNKVYYLTIDGDEPSDDSKGELNCGEDGNIKCISWKENILPWLDDCIKEMTLNIIKPKKNNVIEVMRQFKQNIENFCGIGDNEMADEIKNLLLKSKDNYLSAINLKNGIGLASYEIMLNFFDSLKNEILKNLEEKFNIKTECPFDENALREYYIRNNENAYPYLWFKIDFDRKFTDAVGICFCLETKKDVEGSFCFGVCPPEGEKNKDGEFFNKIIPEYNCKCNNDNWYWYISIKEVGWFNNTGSEDLANLLDETKRDETINKFIKIANDYLEEKKGMIKNSSL